MGRRTNASSYWHLTRDDDRIRGLRIGAYLALHAVFVGLSIFQALTRPAGPWDMIDWLILALFLTSAGSLGTFALTRAVDGLRFGSVATVVLALLITLADRGGNFGFTLFYWVAFLPLFAWVLGPAPGQLMGVLFLGGSLSIVLLGLFQPEAVFGRPEYRLRSLTVFVVAGGLTVVASWLLAGLQRYLASLIYEDQQTGLPNRRGLEQALGCYFPLEGARPAAAVAAVRMSWQKSAQITVGTRTHDLLIRQLAARVRSVCPPEILVGRWSDEVILMVAPGAREAFPDTLLQALRASTQEPYRVGSSHLAVFSSLGHCRLPNDASTLDDLITRLLGTLARADRDPLGLAAFDAQLHERERRELDLLQGLAAADVRRDFFLHYQPQVNLRTEQCTGAEVLLRWKHQGTWVSPAEFIPLTEKTGLVRTLSQWILEQVAQEWTSFRTRGLPDRFHLSVNISASDLADPSFGPFLENLVRTHPDLPSVLELELTEGQLADSTPQVEESLRTISRLGLGKALDDFGTGYSNLRYLQNMGFQTLKIDQSFTRTLDTDGRKTRSILEAIVHLGQSLDMAIVVEGIETKSQREAFLAWGCQTGQGWLWAPAMPKDEFLGWWEGRSAPMSAAV